MVLGNKYITCTQHTIKKKKFSLLSHISWFSSLSHFSCLTSPVSCLTSHGFCPFLISPVSYLLSVSHLLSPVSHLQSPVSYLLSPVSHLLSPVSHLLSHIFSGLGTRSFQKNTMFLRSFPFFIKEQNVFCVLSCSL